MSRLRFLAILLAPIVFPIDAHAFETCEVTAAFVTTGGGFGAFDCATTSPCTSDDDCAAFGYASGVCSDFNPLAPTGRTYCHVACHNIYRCANVEECPVLEGRTAFCTPTALGINICRYSGIQTYCMETVGILSTDQFYRCHATPSPTVATSDYRFGDCDGDGCRNVDDNAPCDPGIGGGVCLIGIPSECQGTTRVPVDAGVDSGDAGPIFGDGGVNRIDGGAFDGSTQRFDASRSDGSSVPVPSFSFGGGGGCRCHVRGPSEPSAMAPLLAGLLGLLALRQRRSRG